MLFWMISFVICVAVTLMTWRIYEHIKKLVQIFHLPSDDTITGQWDLNESSKRATSTRRSRGSKSSASAARACQVCRVVSQKV